MLNECYNEIYECYNEIYNECFDEIYNEFKMNVFRGRWQQRGTPSSPKTARTSTTGAACELAASTCLIKSAKWRSARSGTRAS